MVERAVRIKGSDNILDDEGVVEIDPPLDVGYPDVIKYFKQSCITLKLEFLLSWDSTYWIRVGSRESGSSDWKDFRSWHCRQQEEEPDLHGKWSVRTMRAYWLRTTVGMWTRLPIVAQCKERRKFICDVQGNELEEICIEVPKNAVGRLNANKYSNRTDEVDEMDETLEDGFKDYSREWGPSKGVHACMGSGARSSEDRSGNDNVEMIQQAQGAFILKFWNDIKTSQRWQETWKLREIELVKTMNES